MDKTITCEKDAPFIKIIPNGFDEDPYFILNNFRTFKELRGQLKKYGHNYDFEDVNVNAVLYPSYHTLMLDNAVIPEGNCKIFIIKSEFANKE